MNILLIGSDKSTVPGDPGRSDTQMLVRLDPETKSISMLSLPRDLQVDIPGVGLDKMNEAYSYGGPALVIKTFKQLTGLPVNGWIEVNFAGFWHVVNILGGVYLPIDHKYFVPASADYKSINLEPGYQLVRGKQALNFVRYRHDQKGDFTRMQRQQLFLKEVQRQSGRWSSDWTKVLKLIKAITGETKSSLSSLRKIQPLVELAFQVDTSKVYQAHLEGDDADDRRRLLRHRDRGRDRRRGATSSPTRRRRRSRPRATRSARRCSPCSVYNGSGIDGLATTAATQLSAQGYKAEAVADAYEYPGQGHGGLRAQEPRDAGQGHRRDAVAVRRPHRRAGAGHQRRHQRVRRLVVRRHHRGARRRSCRSSRRWRRTRSTTGRPGRRRTQRRRSSSQAPTAWSSGFTYDQFRNYSIETTEGKRSAASVAVVRTPQYGYWSIQAMRWLDPPAIENPDATQTIGGRTYMLFYQGDHLHMVAWKERGTLYWVLNTLDNQLSNDLHDGHREVL